MEKAFKLAVVIAGWLVMAMVCWAATPSDSDYVVLSPQSMATDYQFRTTKVIGVPVKNTVDVPNESEAEEEPHEFLAARAEEIRARTRELVRQLLQNATGGLADEYVLTVNTFVNLNNLYQTSSLGRYLGEQVIGELHAAGVGVIDVRKSNSLMVRERFGEYGLSRDMDELGKVHTSQAMVVGTYSYADGKILLNARVLRNADGMVVSHASLAFALDSLTGQMLRDEAAPARRGGLVKIEAGK